MIKEEQKKTHHPGLTRTHSPSPTFPQDGLSPLVVAAISSDDDQGADEQERLMKLLIRARHGEQQQCSAVTGTNTQTLDPTARDAVAAASASATTAHTAGTLDEPLFFRFQKTVFSLFAARSDSVIVTSDLLNAHIDKLCGSQRVRSAFDGSRRTAMVGRH